jgi:hypothetical protein
VPTSVLLVLAAVAQLEQGQLRRSGQRNGNKTSEISESVHEGRQWAYKYVRKSFSFVAKILVMTTH